MHRNVACAPVGVERRHAGDEHWHIKRALPAPDAAAAPDTGVASLKHYSVSGTVSILPSAHLAVQVDRSDLVLDDGTGGASRRRMHMRGHHVTSVFLPASAIMIIHGQRHSLQLQLVFLHCSRPRERASEPKPKQTFDHPGA